MLAWPFLGALTRTASGFTDKRYWVRKVVSERPPIVGVPGETYLRAGIDVEAHKRGMKVYLDGEHVSAICFEADTAGGWVGCFEHHYEGGKMILHGSDNAFDMCGGKYREIARYWQFGKVEIRNR